MRRLNNPLAPRAGTIVMAAGVAAIAAALIAGCDGDGGTADDGAGVAYLRVAASRRQALVASLVNPGNSYSALRLEHYASGTDHDWDRLDVWNPRVIPVDAAALDAATSPTPTMFADAGRALALPDEATYQPSATTAAALEALGEEAFFRYPAQLVSQPPDPLSRAVAARYGFWIDDVRGVGGLLWAEGAGGTPLLALSCASCHADVAGGRLLAGVPSRFDLGRLLADAGGAIDPNIQSHLLTWGPGRVDVTTDDASLPERIGDLRPTRWLTHLQYDATVRQLDIVSLAIRIETLLITAHGQTDRPPRIVALALARYLWSLGGAMPSPGASTSAGAALFAQRCAGCHAGQGFTGAPRPLAEIGTDPTLGLSPARGTGMYRVPSLRGAADRPSLFHDGSLPSIDALLDPARLRADYRNGARASGPVNGHPFGLDLSADQRAALLVYLRSL